MPRRIEFNFEINKAIKTDAQHLLNKQTQFESNII